MISSRPRLPLPMRALPMKPKRPSPPAMLMSSKPFPTSHWAPLTLACAKKMKITEMVNHRKIMVSHKPVEAEIQTEMSLAVNLIHRSEEHTSELQSRGHLVCRLLLEKKKDSYKN